MLRDIGEAEIERNKCEEKCWDLNAVIGTKWKELESGFTLKLTLKRVRLDAEMGVFGVLKWVCSGTEMGGFGVLK
uniref:Kinetochore protein NDC80 homolog n=1 Tax=Tanacetum cinerariifolium TaxID=118510 RepID=A0A6L2JHC2_TANCI|nr:kinetochore protein NDC80 homolog [Tanacetum cinerariifolium]